MKKRVCRECGDPIPQERGPHALYCNACETERRRRGGRNDNVASLPRFVVVSAPPETFSVGAEFGRDAFQFCYTPEIVFAGVVFHDRTVGDVVTTAEVLTRVKSKVKVSRNCNEAEAETGVKLDEESVK